MSECAGRKQRSANEICPPRTGEARLETVRAAVERDRPLKVEFAYLKLLPRQYSGPRHIVSVSKRPDGRCDYEERPPGPPPPNHAEKEDPKVMRVYLVRAQVSGDENR